MIIKQRVLPNVRLGDDVRIWKGSIVYYILYFVLETETIISFMAKFLMEVATLIEVPSRRHVIRHECRV